MKSLMCLFIPKTITKKVNTPYEVQQLDVERSKNLVSIQSSKLTIAASEELAKVPNNLHNGLKKSFPKMLQTTNKKIQERRPLQYKPVWNSASLNLFNLVIVDPEVLQIIFDRVLSIIFKNRRISSVDRDKGKEQFGKFFANDVAVNLSDFKNFDFKVTSLDEFLKIYTMNGEKYPEMWKACIFIFALCRGKSFFERGFNVNKDSVNGNLDSSTLEALRVCYDELIVEGNNIKSFEMTKELIHLCKLASEIYREDFRKEEGELSKD